jgi:hypothetical protein
VELAAASSLASDWASSVATISGQGSPTSEPTGP